MLEVWYAIIALLVTAYAVLDGFDLGAGALHLLVADDDGDRRQVLAAIGPYWDGNEVFLLATGGALFLAFPHVLASLLSGLYLAVFLFLWLLILRGIAIEFRGHGGGPLWRAFWDFTFFGASAGLAILLGAAAANVVRGMPLDESGRFALPLFDSASPFGALGILDWYTVPSGLFGLVALSFHGALFLAWKTHGPVRAKSARVARITFLLLVPAWIAITILTMVVRSDLLPHLFERPLAWFGAAGSLVGLVLAERSARSERHGRAFLGSCMFLVGLSLSTAALSYPTLLFAPKQPALSLTAESMAAGGTGMASGLAWWWLAAILVTLYFVTVFRLHREG